MYKTYSFPVVGRTGFTGEENALLGEKNRLWNALVDAHNDLIAKQEAYIADYAPQALQMRNESLSLPAFRRNMITPLISEWHQTVKTRRSAFERIYSDYTRQCKEALAASDVWWPNRERLYKEFINAHRAQLRLTRKIHRRKEEGDIGSGWFSFRFQKQVFFEELLKEGNPHICLTRKDGNAYTVKMAVDRLGRGRSEDNIVYAAFDCLLTRFPPENERIIEVSFTGRQDEEGSWKGQIQFLVDKPEALPTRNTAVVGLDLGWRMGEEGLLCLTASFGDGVYRRLHLPAGWVGKWQYMENLSQAINNSVPINTYWQDYEGRGDEAWLKETASKRREYRGLYRRLCLSRKDYYACFLKELAKVAGVVVMEKMNFGRLAGIQSPTVKIQQMMASPSKLEEMIRQVCRANGIKVVQVVSQSKTQVCSVCGHTNRQTRHVALTCGGCGRLYDPDQNAADNIRRDGLEKLQEKT